MEQIHDNLLFLKRLNREDLIELITLCALEKDERSGGFQYQMALHENHNDVEFSYRHNDNYMYIQASIGGFEHYPLAIVANDFTMKLYDGGIFDYVLLLYLAAKFGNEYVDYLVNKRLNDALAEKEELLADVKSICDMDGSQRDKRRTLKRKIIMEISHINREEKK